MSSTAERSFVDWSGKVTDNGLSVLRLVRRTPPTYAVKCIKCGCQTTEPHSRIAYAECRNAACKLPVRKRDKLDEERARARERERRALEQEAALAEQRMAEQVEGYALPSKVRPAPEQVIMSDRDRQAIRARREEERREEEERQRPIREAEAQLLETHRQLLAAQRKRLTDPAIEDMDVYIAPEVAGASMPKSHAQEHNILEWQKFHAEHKDFNPSNRNIELLHDYHVRNHCEIYTAEMLSRVYQRMKDAGVEFDEPPASEPEQNALDYSKRPRVEIRIAPPVKPQPITFDGFDLETGEPRVYTEREINRMSGDEMKRALRLYPDKLALPNIGPGPKGLPRD